MRLARLSTNTAQTDILILHFCVSTPTHQFTEGVVNLKFDEEPRYEAYMKLFEPLCGPGGPQRPIITEGAPKVGSNRIVDAMIHPVALEDNL